MATLLLSHPACLDHLVPLGHPECPDRLRAIDRVWDHERFQALRRESAPQAPIETVHLCHPEHHVEAIRERIPEDGIASLDPDTNVSPGSWEAALRAVGAATTAVDSVMAGTVDTAFCAIRPPGHHAETERAMGYCLFNNAAIAARHARYRHGAERVAIVDFDVHHGNGTQEIFWSDASVLYASTHQSPNFPGTGEPSETGVGNIVNATLRPGDGSDAFRDAMATVILPQLDAFQPDLVIISAGFDAHRDDPLAHLNLVEADFSWATAKLMDMADKHCSGRIVSVLEGGYDLAALTRSVAAHVMTLMKS